MEDSSGIYIKIPLVWNAPNCNGCGHPEVDIFQTEGEFCCSCWTRRTEPEEVVVHEVRTNRTSCLNDPGCSLQNSPFDTSFTNPATAFKAVGLGVKGILSDSSYTF